MRVKLHVAQRVLFPAGAVVEVEGDEAKRLVSLGFAGLVEDEAPEATEEPKKTPKRKKGE